MKAYQISTLLVLLVFLSIPSASFAEEAAEGYFGVGSCQDLFDLTKYYKSNSTGKSGNSMELGYLRGYLEGFWDVLGIEELKVMKTQSKLYKVIKLPELGEDEDDVGFLVNVFTKWASVHPERMKDHASFCLMDSLYDAYGRTNE